MEVGVRGQAPPSLMGRGRVRVGGMRAGVGGRKYHALHGFGEGNLLHRLSGIQTVALSAVGECAELKLSAVGECAE